MKLTHEQAQTLLEQGIHSLKAGELLALHQHLDICAICRSDYHRFLQQENRIKNGLQASFPRASFTTEELHRISKTVQRQARLRRFAEWLTGGFQNLTWAGVMALMLMGLVWLMNHIPLQSSEPGITTVATPLVVNPVMPTQDPAEPTPTITPHTLPTPQPTSFPTVIPVSKQYRMTLTGHSDSVTSVAFSPDNQMLASADTTGIVNVWWIEDGTLAYSFQAHTEAVTGVTFSPDGKILATSGKDGRVVLWQAQTGQFLRTLREDSGWVKSVSFSPNGALLAITLNDYRVDVIDATTGTIVSGATGYNRFDVLTASSTNYILASSDNAVWLKDSSSLPFGLNLQGQSGKSLDTVLSQDGKFLASGSTDQKIYLWQIYDVTFSFRTVEYESGIIERQVFGSLEMILEGHTGWVNSLGFSPDQQYLVSGAGDGTIKLWHLPDGKNEATLTGHLAGVNSIALSPDGKLLASASDDGTVKLWAFEP